MPAFGSALQMVPALVAAALLAAAAPARGVTLVPRLPASYAGPNGANGGLIYKDESYGGPGATGDPSVAGSALAGGLGDLADGNVFLSPHNSVDNVPWVGWTERPVELVFSFDEAVRVREVRVAVEDSADVYPPRELSVSWNGPNAGSLSYFTSSSRDVSGAPRVPFLVQIPVEVEAATAITVTIVSSWSAWASFSEVQFFDHAAHDGQVLPASYDAQNGAQASRGFFDDSYAGGSGDNTVAGAQLSGGLGDLADGVVGVWTVEHVIFQTPDGPDPFVLWKDDSGPLVFRFDGARRVDSVTVHGAKCLGACTDTTAPHTVQVSCPSCGATRTLAVDPAAAADQWALTVDGLGAYTDEITVRLLMDTDVFAAVSEIEFTGPDCTPVNTPVLVPAASQIDGADLVLSFESPGAATSETWRFAGGLCAASGWSTTADGCNGLHTFRQPLATALNACGFQRLDDSTDDDTFVYEATVEADIVEPATNVLGTPTTRTTTTAFRVRVSFPKSAQVVSEVTAFNSVIELGRLTAQQADPTDKSFEWTFATSVQAPYYLEAAPAASASPSGDFDDVAPAVSGGGTCSGETGACTQQFSVTATAGAAVCAIDGTATLTFAVRCRDNFDGACDLPSPASAQLSFSYVTANICPEVAEVAQVTPSMTTARSEGGAQATDYVLGTTLHGRVALEIEGGLAVTAVKVLELDFVSAETVNAVTGGAFASNAGDFSLNVDGGSGGSGNQDGNPWVDFDFQLNTESVKFPGGQLTGQATMTITAVVEVTYADASAQRFGVETQAVSGPGSVSTAASAVVGVQSQSAATGGSSSTAGSTVLGVSTGTAMVAGVGLVAVVIVAAGAAVAARKRRASRASRVKSSSSTVELNDTAAVQV